MLTPDQSFAAVTEALLAEPGTASGTGFGGTPGVTVEGKIVAMFMREQLVVKLPAERCAEIVESGAGEPMRIGNRGPMREWVAVKHGGDSDWLALAREALEFVRSKL